MSQEPFDVPVATHERACLGGAGPLLRRMATAGRLPTPYQCRLWVGRRHPCRAVASLALWLLLVIPATLHAGDEDGFLGFWATHQSVVSNHTAALDLCTRYLTRTPASAYRPAVAALGAWHALGAGRTNDARAGFAALLSSGATPVALAANDCAQHWLTRFDRESVRAPLAAWYATHASYPDSLKPLLALPENQRPPAQDRWNEPWEYRLDGFRLLKKGLGDQHYILESHTLGAASDLARALAAPFGARLQHVKLVRVVTGTSSPTAEIEVGDAGQRHATLMEGTEFAGIRLAKVGAQSVLLTDGDHWQVLPRAVSGDQP